MLAADRLAEERKNWRKDHPDGFYAKPCLKPDNSTNLMKWETGIPGRAGTDWEGGVFKVEMQFPNDYPVQPPTCRFVPPLFHPNVFSDGRICLSILNAHQGWKPAITIKQMVLGIQDLLNDPNPNSPAHSEANALFLRKPQDYKKRIKEQTKKNIPDSYSA